MKLSILFFLYVVHSCISTIFGYKILAPQIAAIGVQSQFNYTVESPDQNSGAYYSFFLAQKQGNGQFKPFPTGNFGHGSLFTSQKNKSEDRTGTIPFTIKGPGTYVIQVYEWPGNKNQRPFMQQSNEIFAPLNSSGNSSQSTSLPGPSETPISKPSDSTLTILVPVLLSIIIIVCCIVIFIFWRRTRRTTGPSFTGSNAASSTVDFRGSRMLRDKYDNAFMYERDVVYIPTVVAPSTTVGPSDSVSQVSSVRKFRPELPGYQGRYEGVVNGRDQVKSWTGELEVEMDIEKGEVLGLDYAHSVPVVRYIPATPSPPSTLVDSRTGARRNRF
ncbi:hypothetical protein K435DRAFT_787555 [Dendrothele bispora CBS 962.96]|uniref:Uncharacterized protein n=1 Tax=Dendrothele bispora (strain CBS 962.96) TaxID=1314807 RepID=A0A4S8KJ78_DENBC|nr:hypothetical protein K435DRAFT_787555 [Dendrothele bispora CBS 962.96]